MLLRGLAGQPLLHACGLGTTQIRHSRVLPAARSFRWLVLRNELAVTLAPSCAFITSVSENPESLLGKTMLEDV